MEVIPIINEKTFVAAQHCIDINTYHMELGHRNESVTRDTTKFYNIKASVAEAKYTGERLHIGIALPPTESINGRRHWLLALDDSINYI